MRWTVVWIGATRDDLAKSWLQSNARQAVSDAANRIDQRLRTNPLEVGEEFFGDRILVEFPLAVVYAVYPDDRLVRVLQVWCGAQADDDEET